MTKTIWCGVARTPLTQRSRQCAVRWLRHTTCAYYIILLLNGPLSALAQQAVTRVAQPPAEVPLPRVARVILEMSPKPFPDMKEESLRGVCREVFRQWAPLIRQADAVSILLWTADGSEILDYRGRMDDPL